MVGRSISGTQKDVDTKSDSDRCVAMAADGLQLSTFRVSKDEPGRRWERHTISMRPPITLVKTFQIQETSRSRKRRSGGLVRTLREQVRQPLLGIPEALQLHAHLIHQRKVQAAGAPVVVALIQEIERSSAFEPTAAACQHDRQLVRAVRVAVEQARREQQERI